VGRDALLEQQACLEQRLQRQQLAQLGDVGLALAGQIGGALGAVEALAAALRAELPVRDQRLHPARQVEAFLAV
jgi:hypothetical protein